MVPLVQRTEKAYTLTLIHCSRGLCHVTASARFNAGQWASLKRLQLDMAGLIVCAALASDANVLDEGWSTLKQAKAQAKQRRASKLDAAAGLVNSFLKTQMWGPYLHLARAHLAQLLYRFE